MKFARMGSLKSETGSIKTEVGSLKIPMGSLKSENCWSKQEPNCELPLKKNCSSSSDFETHGLTPSTSLNSLTPTSLCIPSPAPKFEENGDHVEIQSPDYSMWESIFSDQLDGDFMMCSPVRITPNSPQAASNYNYNYNYVQVQGQGQNFAGCTSPPPRFPSPLRPNNKGKVMSPLHRFCNSPNNQFMHVESHSLPALDSLLDDNYDKDDDFVVFSPMKIPGGGGEGSSNCLDVAPDQLLDWFTMPADSTRFCGSQASSESGIYQINAAPPQPLSQQLQQERQLELEQQQFQLQNMHNPLMSPIFIAPEQEHDSGLQLVHLLLACAEAVSKEDYMLARRYIHHLKRVVSHIGDSMQRVAACFTEALSERLAATLTNKPTTSNLKPFNPFPPDNLEILKIYQILYQACPYIKFAHFTANQAIFEAFEAEERVHVIDLDILQGYQWPAFMQALAARPGGAPFLRITGVGPSPEAVMETGRCLTELAHSLHVPFEFHPVGEELENLKPHMFNRRVGEALAVNSVNRLQRVPGNCLGNLLAMVRDQAPNIVTIVEQEASHNGPYFLGRFLEALHYYSAIFDSLDATFPTDSAQRAKVEHHIFAPEIRNIVAHEGAGRVMRHERLEKWRKIMEGKGFQGVPLSANAVTQSKILLGLYSCDGYRLKEDKGCLLLGWQDRAILAASAWRC
ncbi:hypothetical protein BUALT_Bualt16G0001200 [Buddleja alternifolia]|uniref:Uncharacterized protein n=1 Tax=Buddleja alternifolia TaxID=168488 RepID=A0AAV6WIG3_9LAMI|nr:hypothetical protein BUALT_Bualt16G0001200 [Buddleja alternifolia]